MCVCVFFQGTPVFVTVKETKRKTAVFKEDTPISTRVRLCAVPVLFAADVRVSGGLAGDYLGLALRLGVRA